MNATRRLMTLLPLAGLLPALAPAAAPPAALTLWPEGVPPAVRADAPASRGDLGPERDDGGNFSNVSQPSLTLVRPAVDRPNGTAVILCPGGGYSYLSWNREGEQFASWLSTLGVTTFILKSRLKEWGHPAPLQDVLRAIRLVRSRAAEFGVSPQRIGVMGSSAGGHLAASASTLWDHPDGRTGAALDITVSARPDFAVLAYPVITMTDPAAHSGSRRSLLGNTPSPALLAQMSVEQQVSAATPPTLLLHTQGDRNVPVQNSLMYFDALTRAGVPAELYVFEQGGHGIGMRDGLGNASAWPRRAEEWLRQRGLLTK